MNRWTKHAGFTIVELLIVIVVIGILAAITITSYSGVQARAYNTAVISDAKQTKTLIDGYIAVNGDYPSKGDVCANRSGGCTGWNKAEITNSNAAFVTELETIGSLTASMPSGNAAGFHGINYNYYASRTYNGKHQPVFIRYWLKGEKVPCRVSGVTMSGGDTATTSTTGYTDFDSGITYCYISIAGPES